MIKRDLSKPLSESRFNTTSTKKSGGEDRGTKKTVTKDKRDTKGIAAARAKGNTVYIPKTKTAKKN